MRFGIVKLSNIALRSAPDMDSAIVTMAHYGEGFKILDHRKWWFKVRMAYDQTEGWVENLQVLEISEDQYQSLKTQTPQYCQELTGFIQEKNGGLMPVLLGANTSQSKLMSHTFEGNTKAKGTKNGIVNSALMYLNAPHLKGGTLPFGIDASGLSQMAYKLNGYALARTAELQSKQGEPLSFIEESEAGDLAFFDNAEGAIDHVGIILPDHHIIHCHGKVRIDRIDHTGIFNNDTNQYSHSLRVIKKIIK
jgi:hypothetical protein